MGNCWLFLSFCNPSSFRFPTQWRQEAGFFSRGVGGEARMSAAWWKLVLTWSFGSTSWQSSVPKNVSGFHGLELVNAIKPIILKPIECRSPLWAPVHIMEAWNLPPMGQLLFARIFLISKIQLVVYYQCCVLIGWATTRLYVIAP